jgi:hypothetical protein
MLSFSLGPDTIYANGGSCQVSRSLPVDTWMVPQIRPLPPPSISLSIHYSSLIQQFGAMQIVPAGKVRKVIVSVILSKKTIYVHVSYSERFPR